MKKSTFFALVVILILGAVAVASAQTIDNDRVSVIFNGDRATVTLRDQTANFAIGELVDAVRVKDFVQDGDYAYADVYVNPDLRDIRAVWYLVKDGNIYSVGYCDGPANEIMNYTNLADAKKALKKEMRDYYALYKTLDPNPPGFTAK